MQVLRSCLGRDGQRLGVLDKVQPQRIHRDPRANRLALVVAAIVGLASGACGPESRDAAARPRIPLLGVDFGVEELRIDGYDADLSPIHWLGVSPAGRIALVEAQDRRVRFYDPSGTSLGSVGREGEGPGEFRWLARAGWIADTLWVSDTELGRTTVTSPELDVLRTVGDHHFARPQPADTGRFASYRGTFPYAVYADGSSLVAVGDLVDRSPIADPGSGDPIFRLSSDGWILDQIATIPSTDDASVLVKVELGDGGVAAGTIPFVPRMVWTVSPNGSRIAVLTTDMASPEPHFRVLTVDSTGREIFDRSFSFAPEPIPDAVIDSAIAARPTNQGDAVRARVDAKLHEAAPSVYAEAEQIVIGSDDRVWVGMRPRTEGTRWMVLSPIGDVLGDVLLPPRVHLRAAGAEHIWCIERDELNVESVVRYRLDSFDSISAG